MKKLDFFVLVLILMASSIASAGGTEGGNGGDLCEARIYEIRNDILLWINNGGPQGLKFPHPTTVEGYSEGMKKQITSANVTCTDEVLRIGSAEKTCINRMYHGKAQVTCNINRFMSLPESDKYVLIHHEYAGLAGFEENNGESSEYRISNQITGFLEQSIVTKLAVKPTGNGVDLLNCVHNYFGSFNTKLSKGDLSFSIAALGFTERLELADKVGLPASSGFSEVQFKIPASQCSWEYAHGRISCFMRNAILIFKNKAGEIEAVPVFKISVDTGVLGVGLNSKQSISLELEVNNKLISHTQIFHAQQFNTSWFVCGRPAI